MDEIILHINPDVNGSAEVKSKLLKFIEEINQKHAKMDSRQRGILINLVDRFNQKNMTLNSFKDSLAYLNKDVFYEVL